MVVDIRLDSRKAVVSRQVDGSMQVKVVSLQSIKRALSNKKELDTGYVSPGTIRYIQRDRNIILFNLDMERRRRVRFRQSNDVPEFDIITPHCIFVFAFADSGTFRLTKSMVFCVKEPHLLQDGTLLYRFPFSNVYQNGVICWGSGRIPSSQSLYTAPMELISLFWSIPFNYDLGTGDVLDQFRDLDGADAFPYDTLVRASYRTLGDLVSDVVGTI